MSEFTVPLFKASLVDLYSCLAEHGYASSRHFGVGIAGTNDDAPESGLAQKEGARRSLAVVGAWLEGDVDCGAGQEKQH